jgi:hypothetical protein
MMLKVALKKVSKRGKVIRLIESKPLLIRLGDRNSKALG